MFLYQGGKPVCVLALPHEKHPEIGQALLLRDGKRPDQEVYVLYEIDPAHEEEHGGVGRDAVGLVDQARRGCRVFNGLVIGGVELYAAGGLEPVFINVQVLDSGIDGPAFIAGVEYAHYPGHGEIHGGLQVEGPFEILAVLRVKGGHRRLVVELGVQNPGQAYREGRVDVDDVQIAGSEFDGEGRVKHGGGHRVVEVDNGHGPAAYYPVGLCLVVSLDGSGHCGAENRYVTILYQAARIIVHHFDDTVHHGIPGVNEHSDSHNAAKIAKTEILL